MKDRVGVDELFGRVAQGYTSEKNRSTSSEEEDVVNGSSQSAHSGHGHGGSDARERNRTISSDHDVSSRGE